MARTCFVATEKAEAAVEASSDRSEVLKKSSQVPAGVHDISTRPGRNASRRELTICPACDSSNLLPGGAAARTRTPRSAKSRSRRGCPAGRSLRRA